MINNEEWLIVGLITSPHGINGKVKIKSLSDFSERFTKPGKRWIQKDKEPPIPFELQSGFQQPGKETFIISFKGITNRTQAENLKQYKILVPIDDLPELKNEEFHLSQLLHIEVKILRDEKLITIGEVIDLENEKNNLLVIQLLENNKKVLVPFVNEIIPFLDIKKKYLIINPPKGLLEL